MRFYLSSEEIAVDDFWKKFTRIEIKKAEKNKTTVVTSIQNGEDSICRILSTKSLIYEAGKS